MLKCNQLLNSDAICQLHNNTMNADPIKLELYKNMLTSVAEEMGVTLQRTAFSPNIKERLDFSCAVFDSTGKMVAQAAHIPVHLGSMPLSVLAAIEHTEMAPGDMIALNDPYRGGTHLPDITLVAPVFSDEKTSNEKKTAPSSLSRTAHTTQMSVGWLRVQCRLQQVLSKKASVFHLSNLSELENWIPTSGN